MNGQISFNATNNQVIYTRIIVGDVLFFSFIIWNNIKAGQYLLYL